MISRIDSHPRAEPRYARQRRRPRWRRLEQLAQGLSREVEAVKDAEQTVLLPGERRRYLNLITDVIVGAGAVIRVMQKAVKRIESSPLGAGPADAA